MEEPDYDDMIDDYVDAFDEPDDGFDEAMIYEEFEPSAPAKPSSTVGPDTATADVPILPVLTQVVTPIANNNENQVSGDFDDNDDEMRLRDFRSRQVEDTNLYSFER